MVVLGEIVSGELVSDGETAWWNVVTRDGETHTVVPSADANAKIEALLALKKRRWAPTPQL